MVVICSYQEEGNQHLADPAGYYPGGEEHTLDRDEDDDVEARGGCIGCILVVVALCCTLVVVQRMMVSYQEEALLDVLLLFLRNRKEKRKEK